MKYVLTLCFILYFSGLTSAQPKKGETTTIFGSIAGFDTKLPIADATASLSGNGITRTVTTDKKGNFSFGELRPGKYNITYEAKGYQMQVRNNLPLASGKRVRTSVLLKTK